jgi:ATP synthase F1 complex assembly factor 1
MQRWTDFDMVAVNNAAPILRRTAWSSSAPFRCYQRRWAQVHDVRFLATHQSSDKVLEKYREKLERKAREEGKGSVDELKQAYKDKIEALKEKTNVPGANAPLHSQPASVPNEIASSIPFQAPPPPQAQSEVTPPPAPAAAASSVPKGSSKEVPTLDSFIDLEKCAALPDRELEAIWRLRHVRDGQSLCATMQGETFRRMIAAARKHPQFIIPLPKKDQGAEIHFLQWTFPSETTATVLFTHLAEFKLRGEYAQPHTTVTHHTDLMDSNELVLMEGRVTENKGVSVDEGKWLLMCLQKFYGFEALSGAAKESKARRQKLMEQFSGGDENFKIEELLEEAEKLP